jgi:hypothetical protein
MILVFSFIPLLFNSLLHLKEKIKRRKGLRSNRTEKAKKGKAVEAHRVVRRRGSHILQTTG